MKFGNYEFREMNEEDFFKNQKKWLDVVFEEDHSVFPKSYLSIEEKEKWSNLKQNLYKDQYKLYLGVFDEKNEFVGWHFGFQENAVTFYMCNSAIIKEHRKKGIYSALLQYVIEKISKKGFQLIYSRHNATNNSVIIPKLKAGFVIANLELDDVFGVLVHLKYFTNKTRRKIMDYRAGQLKPDEELRNLFKM